MSVQAWSGVIGFGVGMLCGAAMYLWGYVNGHRRAQAERPVEHKCKMRPTAVHRAEIGDGWHGTRTMQATQVLWHCECGASACSTIPGVWTLREMQNQPGADPEIEALTRYEQPKGETT